MSINPNSKEYINDLLESNRQEYGAINHLYKEIKALQRKRYEVEMLGMSKATLEKVADYSTRILIYYREIQHLRSCIRGRLDEIQHVREVANHGA